MPKMIGKTFKIDLKNKKILLKSKKVNKIYSINELYSYLMDLFDEPEYMRYDIPIEATRNGKFKLINGWRIDKKAKKYLEGDLKDL